MRQLVAVVVLAFLVSPMSRAAEDESPAPFTKPVVVGVGNRISGRLTVGIVGGKDSLCVAAFTKLAEELSRRGDLRLDVRAVEGPLPRPALTIRKIAAAGEAITISRALIALREHITGSEDVAYFRTAFAALVHRVEGERLLLSPKTLLPGTVDLTVLTMAGEVLLAPGPVRPIDLAKIADPSRTLVRLRFTGEEGLSDEVRYWLPDLYPGGSDRIRVEGAREVPAGEPVFLRVAIDGSDPRSRDARPVRVAVGDRTGSTVTDRAGVATISLAAFGPEEVGMKALRVEVGEAPYARVLEGRVKIVPRPSLLVVETDRPVYRPGGEVRGRVLVVDGVSRAAKVGQALRVTVWDPRRRALAVFTPTTGEFGEATFSLPLVEGLAEGRYRIVAAGAETTAELEFGVEEIRRPPFRLLVELDGKTAFSGEPIGARVTATTFTGDPLAGARVKWFVTGGGDREGHVDLGADGTAALTIPAGGKERYEATLRVVVEKAGAQTTAIRTFRVRPREGEAFLVDTRPSPLVAGVPGKILLSLRKRSQSAIRYRVDDGEWIPGVFREKPVVVRVDPDPWATKVRIQARATLEEGEEARVDLALPVVGGGVIESPDVLRPGTTETIRFRSTEACDPVVLDLYHDGRLVSSATGRVIEGVVQFELWVRKGLTGTAWLAARAPGAASIATRGVRIGTRDLRVDLSVLPMDTSPGAEVTLDARVTGAGGGRAALLDVRAFDRAYLQWAGGFDSPLPGRLYPVASRPAHPLLAEDDQALPLALLDEPAARIARSALETALTSPTAGSVVPWGAPIHTWYEAGTYLVGPTRLFGGSWIVVGAEPPVTARPGREGVWPMPLVVRWESRKWSDDRCRFPVVLPTGAPWRGNQWERARWAVKAGVDDWLAHHQGPGGDWHPHGFGDLCEGNPCEGRGDPRLHPGTTALALLAYLGAGETHKHGRHKKGIKAGFRCLVARQRPDGMIGDPEAPCAMLNHAMATLALTEAYGITGSPLFKRGAQRALDRLRAAQHADGGFRETSFPRGSLALTGWSTLAFKSAKMGGLSGAQSVLPGAREFVLARRDPVTRVVAPTAEEMAAYPFPLHLGSGAPAAITTMILQFTGTDPRESGEFPAIPLPQHDTSDLHAMYWGTLATFQTGGDTWKKFNDALKSALLDHQRREGCARGSWDPNGSPLGRVATTAFGTMCLEVYYRYGRVFGMRRQGGSALRVRSDFPDLAVADLAVPTGTDGRVEMPVRLPDNLTTWEIQVGAWDGRGGYAVGRGAVRSTLPLAVLGQVPARLKVGDRVDLPIRVRSRLSAETEVRVEYGIEGGLELDGNPRKIVYVAPGDARALPLVLRATAAGEAVLRIHVRSEGAADAWEKRVQVVPARVPFAVARPLLPGKSIDLSDAIPADASDLVGSLEVGFGPDDDIRRAVRGLIQRPTGCFEQTAATLYPMLYAIRYLEKAGAPGKSHREDALGHLLTGYQRLLGFETEEGGFSLYGELPVDTRLTALGVHLLSDLSALIHVDAGVRKRAASRLESHLPLPSSYAERVYGVAALARAGLAIPRTFPAWLAKIEDPYVLALAVVHDLVPDGDRWRVRKILSTRRWHARTPSLFAGGAFERSEVVALVGLALHRMRADPAGVADALGELRRLRQPDGAWETTRATVTALRTLIECGAATPVRGRLQVAIDDGDPRLIPTENGMERVFALGEWTRKRRLLADFEGTGRLDLRLVVRGSSAMPPASDEAMAISVSWPGKPCPVGMPMAVKVGVESRAAQILYAPMVVVPLPGGCRVDRDALEERDGSSGFSRILVREGSVELYLTRLSPGEKVGVVLPLIPEFRGEFSPNPARAYPYYEPGRMSLGPGTTITVE